MAISIECENGHRLRALDCYLGKSFACPTCAVVVRMPASPKKEPPIVPEAVPRIHTREAVAPVPAAVPADAVEIQNVRLAPARPETADPTAAKPATHSTPWSERTLAVAGFLVAFVLIAPATFWFVRWLRTPGPPASTPAAKRSDGASSLLQPRDQAVRPSQTADGREEKKFPRRHPMTAHPKTARSASGRGTFGNENDPNFDPASDSRTKRRSPRSKRRRPQTKSTR